MRKRKSERRRSKVPKRNVHVPRAAFTGGGEAVGSEGEEVVGN